MIRRATSRPSSLGPISRSTGLGGIGPEVITFRLSIPLGRISEERVPSPERKFDKPRSFVRFKVLCSEGYDVHTARRGDDGLVAVCVHLCLLDACCGRPRKMAEIQKINGLR